eukprot:10043386-Karenia_brevis.AAC.1
MQGRGHEPEDLFDFPDDFPGPGDFEGRHSLKRLFMVLALAPDLSFGASAEILHFAYDLHMWTLIGSKRNVHN